MLFRPLVWRFIKVLGNKALVYEQRHADPSVKSEYYKIATSNTERSIQIDICTNIRCASVIGNTRSKSLIQAAPTMIYSYDRDAGPRSATPTQDS